MNVKAAARRYINKHVWGGFSDAEAVARIVTEDAFAPGGLDAEWVRVEVDKEFRRKAAAEKRWPPVTDCDRLDEVFSELERQGVIALQNAGMEQSDGLADVAEVYHDAGGPKSGFDGYCFYHGQDWEGTIETGELYLAYGHINGDQQRGVEVGRRIRAVFKAAGFAVKWNGKIATRLRITGMKWQRRSSG